MALIDHFFARAIKRGEFTVIHADGTARSFGEPDPEIAPVTIRFTDPSVTRRILTDPSLGAAEAFILRRAIRVSSVILANLVIGSDIIPEFLQENCTPDKLAEALVDVIKDSPERLRQLVAFATMDGKMSTGEQPPSVRAADIVLAELGLRSS